ncbi:cell division protein FtsZ [Candidatus Falkowbacteria bacterium]|nr:cell division protein FtsZ [Candidatus Falkowbacteria bacterium]
MAEVKPDLQTRAKIKVVGVGGSGGSAVNRMIEKGVKGVEFIAINTDVQALHSNKAPVKLHIGKAITQGLGAGMNPEVGKQAAEESQNEIREALKDAHMVFVTCGMGGGTGTGAGPVVAEIARDLGALTVAVVTKPFAFEGALRRNLADRGLAELSDRVDAIITIPNDRIFQVIDKKTSILDAFMVADDVLRQGVQGIAEVITIHGGVNVDFADVRAIMSNAGSALMGIGTATGENKAIEAAKAAINSPLLETSIEGARGILFTVMGGTNLGMMELQEASKIITAQADEDAKIIFGTVIDEKMKDEIKITVVATGFDRKHGSPREMAMERSYTPSAFVTSSNSNNSVAASSSVDKDEDQIIKHKPRVSALKAAQAEPARKKEVVADEIDDELGIPAFIRKKMM